MEQPCPGWNKRVPWDPVWHSVLLLSLSSLLLPRSLPRSTFPSGFYVASKLWFEFLVTSICWSQLRHIYYHITMIKPPVYHSRHYCYICVITTITFAKENGAHYPTVSSLYFYSTTPYPPLRSCHAMSGGDPGRRGKATGGVRAGPGGGVFAEVTGSF